ncbi:MAG: cyanophycinase [Deltaproteobacteria bacterium]
MTGSGAGWRMLLGGSGENGMDRRLVRRFVELAGGAERARVLVVPTASEETAETIAYYLKAFKLEDTQHVEVLDIRTRADADLPATALALREATAVVFTGGDQLRLLDILMGSEFAAELRRRGRSLVVGGSSAGSMALGDPVIVRGDPAVFYEAGAIRRAPGLGLVKGAIIDTHFVARGRLGRLIAMVSAYPDTIGLGIDEDCGLVVSPDGIATVMGSGAVCVVDGHGADPAPAVARADRSLSVSGLALHVLAEGDRFDLGTRTVRRG